MNRRSGLALASLILALGCSASTDEGAEPASSPTPSVAAPNPTSVATPTATAETTPPHPVSLPALMDDEYDGRDLRVGQVLARHDAYTRYAVTYRSGDLRISGIMNIPAGDGPFPVLVLAHGYIDPAVYTTGRGFLREQDYLARAGYVVLHTDYRNHAGSDDDPDSEMRLRLGYTEDVVNAVLAVKRSTLPTLDRDRVGLLGRSMGGGVVLNALVVAPGLVDAAVIYSSVSSDAVDNFDRWIRGEPGRRGLSDRIIAAYGSPEQNPGFWRDVSPATFFDRVSEPLLMHHGTADDTCPIEWSRRTAAALQDNGKQVTLRTHPGEGHTFEGAWPASIEETAAFFAEHLDG